MKKYLFLVIAVFSINSFAQNSIDITGIYASKMNVLYKKVKNPIKINSSKKFDSIKLSSDIGEFDRYNNFKTDSGKIANIKAVMYFSDKDSVIINRAFRIKPIPKPKGLVRSVSNLATDIKSIQHLKVEAAIPDFEFPILLKVTSFTIRVSNKKPLNINGNELKAATEYLKGLRKGEIILIEGIEAKNLMEHDETIYRPSDIILKLF